MIKFRILKNEYRDSVTLMLAAREVQKIEGVKDAAIVMGTEANFDILKTGGLYIDELKEATPNDLIIAISVTDEDIAEKALDIAVEQLQKQAAMEEEDSEYVPRSLDSALRLLPDANMYLVSINGRYAAYEVKKALEKGLHVHLFSDNVTIEEENELKQIAHNKGLLMMGPDCGTAIINGVPLAFSNKVPKGNIGIVAAAGTGLQEVSTLIAKNGGGVSQAIGTGGRDLKEEILGTMFIDGLRALQADKETEVILLVSKPASKKTESLLLEQINKSKKPTVLIILGSFIESPYKHLYVAKSLEEAAFVALYLSKGKSLKEYEEFFNKRDEELTRRAIEIRKKLKPHQKYVRGLFSGGTLCDEAMQVLTQAGFDIYSNTPLDDRFTLKNPFESENNCIVDMGSDEFTQGRPHPMIDFSLRCKRIEAEAQDKEVAVILLDTVLGYGAHSDPQAEYVPAIRKAKEIAAARGESIIFITSITGTYDDYQDYGKQKRSLEKEGVIVTDSNIEAVLLTAKILNPDFKMWITVEEISGDKSDNLPEVEINKLFTKPLKVINVGLKGFYNDLKSQGIPAIHIDWRPPAGGNRRIMELLEKMR